MHRLYDLPRRASTALIGAAALLVLLLVEWILVFHVGAVQRLDASAYYGFLGLSARPHVTTAARLIANLCDPTPYLMLAAVPVIIALRRRRLLLAGAIVLILAGANETTELLKPLLAAPRPDGLPTSTMSPGSWPSGHATASMALALCMVLASPSRWRPYVAVLGAAFALAVCYSFLTLGWHLPSDALAGLLIASIWTLLGVAWVTVVDAHRRRRVQPVARLEAAEALTPSALAAGAAAGLACLAVLLHPEGVAAYARLHTAFVAGAAAIGVAALVIPVGVLLAIRR
jgi:membrane-associated phospholipid phosphatase